MLVKCRHASSVRLLIKKLLYELDAFLGNYMNTPLNSALICLQNTMDYLSACIASWREWAQFAPYAGLEFKLNC